MTNQADSSNHSTLFYIADMGMVTPLGDSTAMTAAMIAAEISAYKVTNYKNKAGEKITMARVPNQIFAEFSGRLAEGKRFNPRHDRVVKMAILALQQACAQHSTDQAVPLILAMPDIQSDSEGLSSLIANIAHNLKPWVDPGLSRSLHSGRASGIEAIEFAFRYLYDSQYPYLLIGGCDNHEDSSRLMPLDEDDRLLALGGSNGFAPGEAASFLLLTPYIELAQQHNGQVIALYPPGMAEEPGHLFSQTPYLGEGLDQAFKKALIHQPKQSIHRIYSSMNGEHHWAKEYGVAYIRNKNAFIDAVNVQHPADAYGDLGSATATTLIALAAHHLWNNDSAQAHLVYSSSDAAQRGAIVVKKFNTEIQPL